MSNLSVTVHARVRAAQRNVPLSDMDLLLLIGSEVPEGYFVRETDYSTMIDWLRDTEKKLRRWRGARLIVRDGSVITTYRPNHKQEQRLLRDAEERGYD